MKAQMHDGRILEFPDGTDPSVVQKTVKSLLPEQPSNTEAAWTGFGRGAAKPIDLIGIGAQTLAEKAGFDPTTPVSIGRDKYSWNPLAVSQDRAYNYENKFKDNPYAQAGEISGEIASTIAPAEWAVKGVTGVAKAIPYTQKLGEFLASSGVLPSMGKGAIEGATQGVLTGQDAQDSAEYSALTSGAFGAAGKIAKGASGFVEPQVQKMAQVLKNHGVPVDAAMETGSRFLKNVDAAFENLPTTAGPQNEKTKAQLKAFTQAVLKKAGIDAEYATDDVINKAGQDLGQKYNDIYRGEKVNIDPKLVNDIQDISAKYGKRLGPNKTIVDSYLEDILDAHKTTGSISGDVYQATRSAAGKQSKGMRLSDGYTADALKDIRDALDEAAGRSLSPDKAKALAQTRREYGAYKTIAKAKEAAGAANKEGYIQPAALDNAVKNANPKYYTEGKGDLTDLAKAGAYGLKTLPDSGTAQRAMYQALLTGGGAAGIGGATYVGTQSPEKAAMAAAATLAGPRTIQSFLHSKAGQAYLKNGVPGIKNILNSDSARQLMSAYLLGEQ